MYYQILGQAMPYSPPNYRGTYRCGPSYQESLPEAAPVNRAWRQYVQQQERFDDREAALQLAAAYEEIGQSFDVVQLEEVTSSSPSDESQGQLGFDIAQQGWYSLLSWGLHWGNGRPLAPPPRGPLLALMEAHFRPLLNQHGLFMHWSDARFCLDVAEAISVLVPGSWEAPGHEKWEIVQVVAIKLADWQANTQGGDAQAHQTVYASRPDLR